MKPKAEKQKPAKITRLRADELLVLQGLAETRSQAKLLILAGRVYLPYARVEKAGELLATDAPITLTQPPRYVSRGGEKLEGFCTAFPFPIEGKCGLDVGASTGGFSDYLLQHGTAHMTCVDVGHGQLHMRLRNDPRVHNLEKINARTLPDINLPHEAYDIVVMDLSFISLKKILPVAWARVKTGGRLIALVKPQFEAEKKEVDKGKGIIKDTAIHQRILEDIQAFIQAELLGSTLIGIIPSPIQGGDGNQEYLLGLLRE